jgi:ribosomal protein S18 acetylase RimI-like enzyme
LFLSHFARGRVNVVLVMRRIDINAVEIVPIAEGHIEGFHRTLDIVARERRYLTFLEAPPLPSTRAFILDMIRQGYPQFVAMADGEIAGWCDIIPNSRPIRAHCGVLGMGLLPQFRGQGLGRRLIHRTLDAARAFGVTRVELSVREDNANAIALYRKIGFVEEGLQRNAVRLDGTYEHIVAMALLF